MYKNGDIVTLLGYFFFLRVSGGSDKIHKVLKPLVLLKSGNRRSFRQFGGRRTLQSKIIRLLLSTTDAFGCI